MVPFGFLIGTAITAFCVLSALKPPRRPRAVASLAYYLGLVYNEVPYLAFALLALSVATTGGLFGDWVALSGLALACLSTAGLAVIARRQTFAGPAVAESFAPRDRDSVAVARSGRSRLRPFVLPFAIRPPAVRRRANLSYGPAGRRNLLDVIARRDLTGPAPTLVYFHGGRFRGGSKHREALPLHHRLARRGWVCISADYRLRPAARFPDHHIDAKRVIAWARDRGPEYGVDPDRIVAAGSSAGAHMAAMLALTPDESRLQPGFEDADVAVAAAICLYGYYGGMQSDSPIPSSPADYASPDAPPFFIAHGDIDTVVPVEGARGFTAAMREAGADNVIYAEIPGALHSFDLFHSVRSEAVVDGAEAFLSDLPRLRR